MISKGLLGRRVRVYRESFGGMGWSMEALPGRLELVVFAVAEGNGTAMIGVMVPLLPLHPDSYKLVMIPAFEAEFFDESTRFPPVDERATFFYGMEAGSAVDLTVERLPYDPADPESFRIRLDPCALGGQARSSIVVMSRAMATNLWSQLDTALDTIVRPEGCRCHQEVGDSNCPVHPPEEP